MDLGAMKTSETQRYYSIALASEHKQGLHFENKHSMCRACNPEEAKLLDQLKEEEE